MKNEKHFKYSRPDSCIGCPLHAIADGFARTDGSGKNGVLLLGEALGESEAIAGLPFKGDSGMMLNRILHRGGLKREDFLIANVINCRPPNNWLEDAPWEVGAIEHCHHFLEETLAKHPEIKVIVPMGNTALHKTLQASGVKNFHGTVSNIRLAGRNYFVVPTLHPSYVLRTGCKEFPTSLFDITRALKVARENEWNVSVCDYSLFPSVSDFERYIISYERELAADPAPILAADIETNYSSSLDEEEVLEKDGSWQIIRISFSYRTNTAITLPFTGAYIPMVMRLLGGKGVKCFWNGNKFDVPRLRAAGVPIEGLILDGMDAWHVLRPDLPKGLGYVSPFFTDIAPWKHLSNEQPEYYSAVDADVLLRIMLKIRAQMLKEGIWDTFIRYYAELEPRFLRMSEIGVGVDETIRRELEVHYEDIRDNTAALIQEIVPDEVKPRLKMKQGGFKGKPHDVRAFIKAHPEVIDDEAWKALGYQQFEYPATDGAGASSVWRWDRLEAFNHNSADQIARYIEFKYGRSAVPRHKKTGNPTTEADQLERLARQKDDKVLNLILDAAGADGKITSFIKPWTPGPDGRIHPVFTNTPATQRIASQGPNCQNFPRRDAEAMLMRRMIIPGDGFKYFVSADYKSIEAILVGWYANDPDYMRLGYKGVHSYFAGLKLGLDLHLGMSDTELDAGLREAKKISQATLVPGSTMSVYDASKQTVHGGNYLEGAKLLHMTYPELYPTTKAAQEYLDFYYGLFPPLTVWQQQVIDQCYDTCYVMNAWRLRRWLWQAKRWAYSKRLDKWELVNGDDAKKAVATIPQGSAGLIMRGALMSPAAQELLDRGCLHMSIHDDLTARARDKKERDWVMGKLVEAMEYPIKEMDSIVIPVELKVSKENGNWGDMEEIKR